MKAGFSTPKQGGVGKIKRVGLFSLGASYVNLAIDYNTWSSEISFLTLNS